MSTLSVLIEAWDEAYRELGIALENISQEDLWKRPHPRLLSVGEVAAHVGYAQAVWVLGDGNYRPDLSVIPVESPLIQNEFSYYVHSVAAEPIVLDLDAQQVVHELMKIHHLAREFVKDKEVSDTYPGQWETWGNVVQYQVFHVAYHTGQIYSARHLMGHETEDN